MNQNPFENLCLNKSILRAVSDSGYTEPSDIQRAAIPEVLAGRDLVATAQTGTGKTAAFALPLLELLNRKPADHRGTRALILTPTRELALQIQESLRVYGRHLPFRSAVVLGGVSIQGQVQALRLNPEVIVATPGRLRDLMRQKHVRLGRIEMLILDEADRMLDMGFINDVRSIVAETPASRQTLLFSATMSKEIAALAADLLSNPVRVQTTPPASVANNIKQKVMFVDQADKGALLAELLGAKDVLRALVFTRTKHRADRVAAQLSRHGISADAIHSNKSQNARQRALSAFDRGRIRVLVATDILSRGIDVDAISHVINYEMPNDPESYVHRVGRTARAGAAGVAWSFCDSSEVLLLGQIEKLTRSPLARVVDHPFHSTAAATGSRPSATPRPRYSSRGRR